MGAQVSASGVDFQLNYSDAAWIAMGMVDQKHWEDDGEADTTGTTQAGVLEADKTQPKTFKRYVELNPDTRMSRGELVDRRTWRDARIMIRLCARYGVYGLSISY